MAHIIEVVRESETEACSFLDALFYSDSVSAVGYRPDGKKTRVIVIKWDAEGTSELDEQVSQLITDALNVGGDLDEIAAYCRIFPDTVLYQPEILDIKIK